MVLVGRSPRVRVGRQDLGVPVWRCGPSEDLVDAVEAEHVVWSACFGQNVSENEQRVAWFEPGRCFVECRGGHDAIREPDALTWSTAPLRRRIRGGGCPPHATVSANPLSSRWSRAYTSVANRSLSAAADATCRSHRAGSRQERSPEKVPSSGFLRTHSRSSSRDFNTKIHPSSIVGLRRGDSATRFMERWCCGVRSCAGTQVARTWRQGVRRHRLDRARRFREPAVRDCEDVAKGIEFAPGGGRFGPTSFGQIPGTIDAEE